MTSPKYLNSKVNLRDFVRSLKSSVLFPLVALVVLFLEFTLPVIDYVTSTEFKREKIHTVISMFTDGMGVFGIYTLIPIGMLFCGMLVAIRNFHFAMSKKQTNVYFSLGMKRTVLFLNRVAAGAVCLFLAVLIPMSITLLINLVNFGASAHLFKVYLYLVFTLTTYGLVGLAIGTLASSVSGNLFEAGLTSISASLIPLMGCELFKMIKGTFLKGYVSFYNINSSAYKAEDLFNPYFFDVDLSANFGEVFADNDSFHIFNSVVTTLIQPLKREWTVPADKFEIPEPLVVDIWFFLPVIIWFAVSLLVAAGALILFKKRKAEHAKSFGNFPFATAINATVVYFIVSYIAFNLSDMNIFLFAFLFILITAVAYFLTQLILKRKIKATLKSLAYYGALLGVTAIMFVTISTEFFGTYNKLPDKEDIKSVKISVLSGTNAFSQTLYGYDEGRIVGSANPSDIEMVVNVFNTIHDDSGAREDILEYINFVITDADGEEMVRSLPIYSEEVYFEYMRSVYASDYFDMILKKYFIDENSVNEDYYYSMGHPADINNAAYDTLTVGSYKEQNWLWFDGSLLYDFTGMSGLVDLENYEGSEEVTGKPIDGEGLCRALYEDLSKMTFDQLCLNPNRPIGALSFGREEMYNAEKIVNYGSSDSDSVSSIIYGPSGTTIYIYPEMTETIKFLNENGCETVTPFDGKIKEILYTDGTVSLISATNKFAEGAYGNDAMWLEYYEDSTDFWSATAMNCAFTGADRMNGDITATDYVKNIYSEYGQPLSSVTDEEKIDRIFNASVPFYTILGDKGRYVFVIYEDGPIVPYYLPEASLGVLK